MKNTRGYGYWIWKYFLISELFKKINDDEVILYVDAGCTINENGTKKLKDYYDKVVENGMLAFQMPHLIEKHYTKMDTYKKIIGRDMSHYETGQVHASTFFIKKNQKNMEFIENIKSICVQDNYHYVDDSKSIENNNKSFIENRHDQSIFSLMCKKYKSYLIDDETYWEPNWSLFGKEYPLWVTRIK
jgi:hypothetical protein